MYTAAVATAAARQPTSNQCIGEFFVFCAPIRFGIKDSMIYQWATVVYSNSKWTHSNLNVSRVQSENTRFFLVNMKFLILVRLALCFIKVLVWLNIAFCNFKWKCLLLFTVLLFNWLGRNGQKTNWNASRIKCAFKLCLNYSVYIDIVFLKLVLHRP